MQTSGLDPQAQKQKEKVKGWEHQRRLDAEVVMSTANGRRFVKGLIEICRMGQPSYVPGSFDQTAFNDGMKAIGNQLLELVHEANTELYSLMMTEAKKGKVAEKVEPKEDQTQAIVE